MGRRAETELIVAWTTVDGQPRTVIEGPFKADGPLFSLDGHHQPRVVIDELIAYAEGLEEAANEPCNGEASAELRGEAGRYLEMAQMIDNTEDPHEG